MVPLPADAFSLSGNRTPQGKTGKMADGKEQRARTVQAVRGEREKGGEAVAPPLCPRCARASTAISPEKPAPPLAIGFFSPPRQSCSAGQRSATEERRPRCQPVPHHMQPEHSSFGVSLIFHPPRETLSPLAAGQLCSPGQDQGQGGRWTAGRDAGRATALFLWPAAPAR